MSDGLPSSNVNVTQNGLKGSTIQIRVTMDVDQDNERFKLDDIKVTGQAYKINLCYGDPLNLGGSPTANWSGTGNPTITYHWTPSTGLSDPNISNPIATPTSPIIFNTGAVKRPTPPYKSQTLSPNLRFANFINFLINILGAFLCDCQKLP